MFLNTELWVLLPVKPTFTTLQLNEFRFMASKKNDKIKLVGTNTVDFIKSISLMKLVSISG